MGFQKISKSNWFQPVVDGDVSLKVELSMTELDNGKSCWGERLYFVHTWNTLSQNGSYQIQDFHRSGCGQVYVRQNGVLGAAVFRRILSSLLEHTS